MSQEELSSLIGQIYEASVNPSDWGSVVDAVADWLNASIANISRFDLSTQQTTNLAPRVSPELHRSFEQRFASQNPFLQPASQMPVAKVFSMEECLPRRVFIRSEMYGEWLQPQQMEEGLAANFGVEGSVGMLFAAWRPSRLGSFNEEERGRFELLSPHLLRATKISLRLHEMDFLASCAAGALDRLSHGIAVLDGKRRVRLLNRRAEDMVAEGDAIQVRNGLLAAALSHETKVLDSAVNRAVEFSLGSTLRLARPGRGVLTLLVSPLNMDSSWLGLRPPGALVVITDPEGGDIPPASRLIQAYGLTAAEAAVARELLRGHDIATSARNLHITYETARTHLRRIFAKTGIRRQSDLVRQLMRTVGAII